MYIIVKEHSLNLIICLILRIIYTISIIFNSINQEFFFVSLKQRLKNIID